MKLFSVPNKNIVAHSTIPALWAPRRAAAPHTIFVFAAATALALLTGCGTALTGTRAAVSSATVSTDPSSSASGTGSANTSGLGEVGADSFQPGVNVPAPACTIYAAANGAYNNSGDSASSPTTLPHAASMARPGDVVCLASGTYSIPYEIDPRNSGTANAWITYTAYNGAVTLNWTGPVSSNLFHMYSRYSGGGPSYIRFQGLTLNGNNKVQFGFFCQNSHHIQYSYNTITNMGEGGIGSMYCDYQTANRNIVYHTGYSEGWSSGISFNASYWSDGYSGLHNIIADNVIAGSYDNSSNHTDGNGIMVDTSTGSYAATPSSTPPVLIANNVVYGNGGRCIENFNVSNIWVINNTCYDNMLDLTLGRQGEIVNNRATNNYYVNNLVESWNNESPLSVQGTPSFGLVFRSNMIDGGAASGVSSTGFTTANPDFINPPSYNATQGGQYANTINPASLGDGLDIQSNSPAIGAGIDPASLAGSNTQLKNDLANWIYTDIDGNSRPIGGPFTLGAYQDAGQ
jgi:hypothetical protein